jgi:hypothetical protein
MAHENSIALELPLRGSNEDHLEIFASVGARWGAYMAECVGVGLRLAARAGVSTVRQYSEKLKALEPSADATILADNVERLRIRPDATVITYQIAVSRADLATICNDLSRSGYRKNQTARFRVSAWRAFKLALREAGKMRVH